MWKKFLCWAWPVKPWYPLRHVLWLHLVLQGSLSAPVDMGFDFRNQKNFTIEHTLKDYNFVTKWAVECGAYVEWMWSVWKWMWWLNAVASDMCVCFVPAVHERVPFPQLWILKAQYGSGLTDAKLQPTWFPSQLAACHTPMSSWPMCRAWVARAPHAPVGVVSCILSMLHQGVLHDPPSLIFDARLYLIVASKPLLPILLSPNLKSQSLVHMIRITMWSLLLIMNPLLKTIAFPETNAFFPKMGIFQNACILLQLKVGFIDFSYVYHWQLLLQLWHAAWQGCPLRWYLQAHLQAAHWSILLSPLIAAALLPHLLLQHGYGFATSSQRSPVAPTKGGVERKITSEEAGSNYWNMIFAYYLCMTFPLKKTFATKKISSWIEAIILWNSASSHLVIEILIPFHSSLDNPTRRVHNERKFFIFNKQTISYKKDNLVPKFLNTRMDLLRKSPTILSTWDSEIWLPPCEGRVAPTHWGDANPISASIKNTPMPHTHTHACWEKSIHGKETSLSTDHIHWMHQTPPRNKKKGIIRSAAVFIGAEKELLQFWIQQQQNYTKIVEKLGIHYPQQTEPW